MLATRPTQQRCPPALQALAAEVVSLEERCLHLRSSELRAAREAEGAAEVRHRSEHRSQMTAQEVASLEATIQALRVGMLAPSSSTKAVVVNRLKKAACRCCVHVTGPADGTQEPDASPATAAGGQAPGQCYRSRCQGSIALEAYCRWQGCFVLIAWASVRRQGARGVSPERPPTPDTV